MRRLLRLIQKHFVVTGRQEERARCIRTVLPVDGQHDQIEVRTVTSFSLLNRHSISHTDTYIDMVTVGYPNTSGSYNGFIGMMQRDVTLQLTD